jgi:shikimate kinase
MKKIILCGYMGSGKTTTARLLAKTIGIDYLDLDEIIEKTPEKPFLSFLKNRVR